MRLPFIIVILFIHTATYAVTDTIKLYFDIGIPSLSAQAKAEIDSLMYFDILLPGKKVGIVGYADYLGSEASNITLSENRAKNVQEYLVATGIKQEDIQIVMGKGEVSRDVLNGRAGYREDRRVDIIPGGIREMPKIATPTMDLSKISKNGVIRLENLNFKPASHIPTDASYPELKKLFTILKENPKLKISIEGHICCVIHGTTDGYDTDADDFNLSLNRAKYVYEYMVKKGIAAERLAYKGFGKTKPLIIQEKTPEDENKNRRVEIRIVDK
jgi:outer membrane protein OmpA-like peptidoglycan-associated protein